MKQVGTIIAALTVASSLMAVDVAAQELKVVTPNIREYFDPGRDHSNTGSMQYYNTFDTLIDKDHRSIAPVFLPGLAESWKMLGPRRSN